MSHDKVDTMPEEKKTDEVEKLLAEEKSFEVRKQTLIDELLKEREAAMAAFDEKLAKLGYHANSGKSKKKHDNPPAVSPVADGGAKPPTKLKS